MRALSPALPCGSRKIRASDSGNHAPGAADGLTAEFSFSEGRRSNQEEERARLEISVLSDPRALASLASAAEMLASGSGMAGEGARGRAESGFVRRWYTAAGSGNNTRGGDTP